MATYGIFEIPLPENPTLHESWNHIESMRHGVDHHRHHLPLPHHNHHYSFTEIFGQLYLNNNLDAESSLSAASSSVFTLSPSSSISSSDLSHDEDNDVIRCESKRSRKNLRGEFPPPLSCMGKTGKPVWLHSIRQDGRFILTQVRVPTQDYLQAYRENGRLKLHYFSSEDEDEEEDENKESKNKEQEVDEIKEG